MSDIASTLGSGAGVISIPVRPDADGFGRDLDRQVSGAVSGVSGSIGARFASVGATAAGAFGVAIAGIGVAVGATVGVAIASMNRLGELQGIERRFSTVFGEMSGTVGAFADDINERMGLSVADVKGLAAGVQDLLVPLGFSREAAASMTQQTVTMGAALSEWTGGQVSATDATNILTTAFLGEYDSLQSLGIAISAADVEARLAAKGQAELTGEARKQAEAVAVQELVMRNTTDAQAAYAAGASPATQAVNNIRAAFSDFRDRALVTLGPYLTRIAEWAASELPGALATAERWITGTAIPAFESMSEWWSRNGPAVVEAVKAIGRAAQTMAEFVGMAFRAVNTAAEFTGQVVFGAVRFMSNLFLGFAENTLGVMARVAEALGRGEFAQSLRDAQTNVRVMKDEVNAQLERITRSTKVDVDTAPASKSISDFIAANSGHRITMQMQGKVTGGAQVGDGPGAPPVGPAGRAHDVLRREIAALGGGMSITSGYRTPARNAAVGGSPTSYHMDAKNPAGDVVGPAAKLDALHARLKRIGGRELIWRAPGHYDHLHYAHSGGVVSPTWPTTPGLRPDERPAVLQIGEKIIPRGQANIDGGQTFVFNVNNVDAYELARRASFEMRMA